MATERASLYVNRIERPSWSHTDLLTKGHWSGVYRSAEGLVRVEATKPWTSCTGEDRPGYVSYDVIIHGVNVSFHERKYRTPKGVGIIAGRLLRMLDDLPRRGYTLSQYAERINARWSGIYGGPLA